MASLRPPILLLVILVSVVGAGVLVTVSWGGDMRTSVRRGDTGADAGASLEALQLEVVRLRARVRELELAEAPAGTASPRDADRRLFRTCLARMGVRADVDPLPPGESLLSSSGYRELRMAQSAAAPGRSGYAFNVVLHSEATNREWWIFWARAGHHVASWEAATLDLYRFLLPGRTLIDFGMWIGPTVLFGSRFADAVYGIEPDPVAYAEAVRNVVANNNDTAAPHVHLRNLCIADKGGQRAFHAYKAAGDSMSSLLWQPQRSGDSRPSHASLAPQSWVVDCLDLPSFVAREGLEGARLVVKIDTEGGEAVVLQTPGIGAWFLRNRVTVLLSMHIGHVRGSMGRLDAYPQEAVEAVGRVIAAFPFIYVDDALLAGPRTHFDAARDVCSGCQYVLAHEPLPDALLTHLQEKAALQHE
jgi:FkbM family methyltransferase